MPAYQVKREWQRDTLATAIQDKILEAQQIAAQQGGSLKLSRLGEHVADMFEEVVVKSPVPRGARTDS
jgi:hypothetical protein